MVILKNVVIYKFHSDLENCFNTIPFMSSQVLKQNYGFFPPLSGIPINSYNGKNDFNIAIS